MKRWILVLIGISGSAFLSTSCASMPGGVGLTTSGYDGTKQLVMQPGWANAGMSLSATLKVGVWKSSSMKKDEVYLVVRNDMIENFAFEHPNFFIKIDGKETALSPIETSSNIEISSASDVAHTTQEYPIKLALIEEMLASKDVKFRLLLQNGVVEGDLSKSGPTTARSGFANFMAKAKTEFNL